MSFNPNIFGKPTPWHWWLRYALFTARWKDKPRILYGAALDFLWQTKWLPFKVRDWAAEKSADRM